MSIEVDRVSKRFAAFTALDDVSLRVQTGELVALLGPSGSGKTTLLRIIAGLEAADPGSGAVRFHDQDVTDRHVGQRGVGFVFQHYALFRHMTVFENIAFGLKVRPRRSRPPRGEIRDRVQRLLQLVQLENQATRYPNQLSGGQRQRVALARALAVEPRVLLLDEPFGALDAQVRRELRRWLRKLHDEVHITSVFVTHDQEEALEVADRVAVMNRGKIEQLGTPEQVYANPATPFVYEFLGSVNLFHGRVDSGQVQVDSPHRGSPSAGAGPSPAPVTPAASQVAYVRPHDIELARQPSPDSIPARVEHIHLAGPVAQVYLIRQDNQQPIEAAIPHDRFRALALQRQDLVHVQVKNARVFAIDYSI